MFAVAVAGQDVPPPLPVLVGVGVGVGEAWVTRWIRSSGRRPRSRRSSARPSWWTTSVRSSRRWRWGRRLRRPGQLRAAAAAGRGNRPPGRSPAGTAGCPAGRAAGLGWSTGRLSAATHPAGNPGRACPLRGPLKPFRRRDRGLKRSSWQPLPSTIGPRGQRPRRTRPRRGGAHDRPARRGGRSSARRAGLRG